jgi:hypothetical protein
MENSAALLICFQSRYVLHSCGTEQLPLMTLLDRMLPVLK